MMYFIGFLGGVCFTVVTMFISALFDWLISKARMSRSIARANEEFVKQSGEWRVVEDLRGVRLADDQEDEEG